MYSTSRQLVFQTFPEQVITPLVPKRVIRACSTPHHLSQKSILPAPASTKSPINIHAQINCNNIGFEMSMWTYGL